MTVFRVCSAKHAENDGEGARIAGGRWNHKGVAVVYCSQTASLAALEVLAHAAGLPVGMVAIAVQLPESLAIASVERRDRPAGWDGPISRDGTKEIGARWIRRNRTAILSVPSAIVPDERNYLLNPRHPDFRKIRFGAPKEFRFDPRLK